MSPENNPKRLNRQIIPPICTPVIDEHVSREKLRFNIEKMNRTQVGGYLVLGSNGESVLLTNEERLKVIETTRSYMSPEKLLVAGTGQESTRETIALTKKAAELGADYVLIGNPQYFKASLKVDILYDHFIAAADSSPVPVIVYNSPGFTGINLAPELIEKLSKHPNICGVKDGTGNIAQLAEFIRRGGPDFLTITGNAPTFLPALFSGISGGMMPISNIYPDAWVRLMNCYYANNFTGARHLEAVLGPMTSTIMSYGPGGIKAAMDFLGYYGGPPLLPLKPPTPAEAAKIQDALKAADAQLAG